MAQIKILINPAEILQVRLNQPRMPLEFLRQQMESHRQASEEFSKAVRNGTSECGAKKVVCGTAHQMIWVSVVHASGLTDVTHRQ